MKSENKHSVYKTIMLVIITITITIIGTTIVLEKYYGKNVKYVMLPSSDGGLSSEISRLKTMIDKFYLGEIDEQSLIDSALQGYVKGLNDEYSEYIPKKDMEEFSTNTTGNYDGVGIYYGRMQDTKELVIISPIKNSPAHRAGILPGDIIEKINDEEMDVNENLTDISNKIRGKEGTTIKLTIKRGDEIKEFSMERENIKLHYIESKTLENNIGYIEITSFDQGTANEFEEKYNELKKQNITSLIIDIRNNGGGIVQEATGIADFILKKDSNILIIKDKNGKEEITKAKKETSVDLPIIVLTNENSASASEILAGALKDNNVAKIVGTKTYGKGVIQNVFTLSNGTGLKLTTNEYFTPGNNKINHIGIEPDVKVELSEKFENELIIPDEHDTQLQKAIELLK